MQNLENCRGDDADHPGLCCVEPYFCTIEHDSQPGWWSVRDRNTSLIGDFPSKDFAEMVAIALNMIVGSTREAALPVCACGSMAFSESNMRTRWKQK